MSLEEILFARSLTVEVDFAIKVRVVQSLPWDLLVQVLLLEFCILEGEVVIHWPSGKSFCNVFALVSANLGHDMPVEDRDRHTGDGQEEQV